MKSNSTAYGKVARLLHWISALLIIVLWIMGKVMTNSEVASLYKTHVALGLLVLVLTAVRIVWFFVDNHPTDLPMLGWQKQAFVWNHRLILLVTILLVSSGVGILLLSEIGLSPANVTPDLIQDVPPLGVHHFSSLLMALLFLMHVGGVLRYQFTKGDTLGRMGINFLQRK